MRNKLTISFLILVLALSASPARAEGNLSRWFHSMFHKEKGPRPEDTLVAPFAETDVKNQVGPKAQVPSASLKVPHRSARDVGIWAITAVSDSLSSEIDETQEHATKKQELFDGEGYGQFLDFRNQVIEAQPAEGRPYNLESFVPREPVLLNEGELNGAYRWLFEMPVMVTYQPPGLKDYKNQNPVVKSFSVRVQVGRVESGGGDDVRIETWAGRTAQGSWDKP